MKNKQKRIVSIVILATLLFGIPEVDTFWSDYGRSTDTVFASTNKQKKKKAEKDLEKVKDQMDEVEDSKKKVNEDINEQSAKLRNLLSKQEKVKGQIENKQNEIDQCNKDLKVAQDDVTTQYQSMKQRIQFMYENSTSNSLISAIFDAKGFSDMLNRIEYVTEVHQSDRKLMQAYNDAVDKVVALSDKLNKDMDDLVALQDQYEKDQGDLEQVIANLEDKKEQYADEYARYEQQAKDYEKKIDRYAKLIQEEEAAAANAGNDYDGGGTGNGGVSNSVDYLNDPKYDPKPRTNVSGQAIVAYALQFVGNPYVWGGNSLTKGCDCSGFVHLIYKHFGISTPRYSQAFKSQGQPVAFCNIKAGDVVVYPGHVAIYIGNGNIVEAQSTKAGITKCRSVKCHTITGLRRYV